MSRRACGSRRKEIESMLIRATGHMAHLASGNKADQQSIINTIESKGSCGGQHEELAFKDANELGIERLHMKRSDMTLTSFMYILPMRYIVKAIASRNRR